MASTYYAEGYPYAVIHHLAEILFREWGASLEAIGLTALFHLPWNLKFLWGPFLDRYGTKRAWLIGTEVVITALLVLLAFATTLPGVIAAASVAFALIAFASATHDIAIDGYYLEALDDAGQSRFVGYRAMAYRLATLTVSGGLVVLIANAGWLVGLIATALIMGGVLALHTWTLPRVERPGAPMIELVRGVLRARVLLTGAAGAALIAATRTDTAGALWADLTAPLVEAAPWLERVSFAGWLGVLLLACLGLVMAFLGTIRRRLAGRDSFYARAFVDFLEQPAVGRILAFVVLFRVGESFLVKMRYPFIREAGMSMEAYGLANGTLGVIALFVGTLAGGWLISRHGLRRWIWPLTLAQNVPNALFVLAASWHEAGGVSDTLLGAVICLESLGSGFGTAVFMVYLMRCCRPGFKAAHMAIVTALMSVGFTIAGVVSGALAESLGFSRYFGLTLLATLPGMMMIPFIPHLDARQQEAR